MLGHQVLRGSLQEARTEVIWFLESIHIWILIPPKENVAASASVLLASSHLIGPSWAQCI